MGRGTDEELRNWLSPLNVLTVIKSMRKWARHVALTRLTRNPHLIVIGKPERRKSIWT